ncbi:MAG: response regulator [Candidatus Thorarchaeota archaeon]
MVSILIVDDEPSIQFTFEKIFLFFGFEIAGIANNGEEAINLFKSLLNKPDIILMDHRMPIKNGLEATKEILQINSDTKIVLTSADSSIKDTALSLGAVGFQNKPFKIKNLIETLQKVIEI